MHLQRNIIQQYAYGYINNSLVRTLIIINRHIQNNISFLYKSKEIETRNISVNRCSELEIER